MDIYTKPLLCYQLGNKYNQYVFDQSSYSIALLKDLFESNRLFLIHNALFDLQYLYYYNIWPKKIYDTMLAEQVIWLGLTRRPISPYEYKQENYNFPYLIKTKKTPPYEEYYELSYALNAISRKRIGIELDKSVRGKIKNVGLTPEVIVYAAEDVAHLENIKDSQQIDIERENLQKAVELENESVKWIAYMKFCGVKLDVKKWEAKMSKDNEKLNLAINKLNSIVLDYFNSHDGDIKNKTISIEHIIDTQWIHNEKELKEYNIKLYPPSIEGVPYTRKSGNNKIGILYCEKLRKPYPFVDRNLQGDIFTGFNTEPFCTLNWSSSKQIIPFFELLGFNMEIFDKKEKVKKKSAAAEVIYSQKEIFPELAEAYVQFKKAEKVCDSFGLKWIKAINPVTGRIHADFRQLGTATARLSSGGGDNGVNVQQIPRDSVTRACFISEKGNKWLSEDYMAQESRILASVTNDSALIDLYTNGCGDLHSLTAYMSFPDIIPRDTRIEDIAHLYKEARQNAKSIEFAFGYGGDYNTIAANNGIPIKEAKKIYDDYMRGFPGVKKYQDYCRREVLNKGYILMNPVTGHRAHIDDWDNKWKKIRDYTNNPNWYEMYKRMKAEDPYSDEVYWLGKWNNFKTDIGKSSINYRIQNRGAMATKLSGILFFNWIIKNNLQNKVKICLQIHDEFNVEAPEDIAEEVAIVLQKCMEKGASPFCTRLPLSSDISREEDGNLPNYWIH